MQTEQNGLTRVTAHAISELLTETGVSTFNLTTKIPTISYHVPISETIQHSYRPRIQPFINTASAGGEIGFNSRLH